jgi:enoyl-CoA hydratase/carnithine racemase
MRGSRGSPVVRVDRDGAAATVTLDRADQRNALSIPMLEALVQAFGDLAVEPEVRVVVLVGAGPDFCAGADFAELEQARSGGAGPIDFDEPFRQALRTIAEHPVPVVATVQGRALGGGCQLVLACDLAVAAEDALLGIPSAKLGIVIPYDSIERLVLAVGSRRARDMLFTGRVLTGVEADGWGLVARTGRPGALAAATGELVRELADAAPLSVRASKRGIAVALERLTGSAPPNTRVTDFDMMAAQALASQDLAEGIAAFRERRKPSFKGK